MVQTKYPQENIYLLCRKWILKNTYTFSFKTYEYVQIVPKKLKENEEE